jgi:SpoVK/Ycf46/Vps4 family AAA+-type ATPase
MSDPVTGFIEASVLLAGIGDPSGPTAAEAAANDHVAMVRSSIALPLPRTEKRLRVPLEVAGQMLTGIGDRPRPYDRYLLPPAVQALSAAALADPQVLSHAERVMNAWRGVVGELADGAALTSILATIDGDRWKSIVDPGDFLMAAESLLDPAWGIWDASARAALASLPPGIKAGDRLPLLLGLWAGAGRTPQLAADWVKAEEWIDADSHAISAESHLGAARVWAMSSSSPIYQQTDRHAVDAFVAWAYRRAGTWQTFTSADPEIHSRLREQWPEPPAAGGERWLPWVKKAVSINEIKEPTARPIFVRAPVATTDGLLADLGAMIGIEQAKAEIAGIVNLARMEQARAAQGLPTSIVDLHMVFSGNPGTGKTTVARLYGQILRSLGLLSSGNFIEVTRADLVGKYHAEASEKTRRALDAADGGVLFIDEAYSLTDGRSHGDGAEVINELVAAMESRRGSFALVVAGYPGAMAKFLESNPGLGSRFRDTVLFPDLSNAALYDALVGMLTADGYRIDEAAVTPIKDWIAAIPRGEGFGNVRDMRKLTGILRERMASRFALDPSAAPIEVVLKSDVPALGPGEFDEEAYESAIADLDSLVGLAPVKAAIRGLTDKARLAQLVQARGKPVAPIDIGHMVFTGNPGTGKTTVAVGIGRILVALGLLRNGHVHVVGQASLIGEYLGQTAPKVRAAIHQALDGVLFIDEAYALTASSNAGAYQLEAVTTLVDEMERHRGRLVVIMAGYPDQMATFLQSNEGLKSRVAHSIDFPDFDREQMRTIAASMVQQRRMRIDDDAADLIADLCAAVASQPGFANARTVRNMVDEAVTRHASRVVRDLELQNDSRALITIERQDVPEAEAVTAVPFGFLT